jgi:hypothetical protein
MTESERVWKTNLQMRGSAGKSKASPGKAVFDRSCPARERACPSVPIRAKNARSSRRRWYLAQPNPVSWRFRKVAPPKLRH